MVHKTRRVAVPDCNRESLGVRDPVEGMLACEIARKDTGCGPEHHRYKVV